MTNKTVDTGTVHSVPADFKKAETRQQHIERAIPELKAGKRRPCCWIGCIHRTDKEISPSVKHILSKKSNPK